MANLIDALQRAGKSSAVGFGFSKGAAAPAKPRSAAIITAAKSSTEAESLTKAGADILVLTPEAAKGFTSTATWGVDLRGQDALAVEHLRTQQGGGAAFALLSLATPARVFTGKVEQFDRVLEVTPPTNDPLLVLLRTFNLIEADVVVLQTNFTARDLAELTVEQFALLRATRESLRAPLILTLREVPAETDLPLIMKLGAQGLWLQSATSETVTRLREALERIPREPEDAPLSMNQLRNGSATPGAL